MAEITGETQTKNDGEKDKDYSMECLQETRIAVYKGKMVDRRILNWVPFINTFGGAATRIIGMLGIIIGIIIASGSVFLLEINWFLYPLGLIVGMLLIGAGVSLTCNIEYAEATKCKKCHKNYAYEEREEPDIKELSNANSFKVTTTRYWKCKHCGYIDSSESPAGTLSYKGTKGMPREIECEKCGKTGLSFECRDPDTKEIRGVPTIRRYYKCKYCGNISTTEVEIPPPSYHFVGN
ncbi:hypothetical protein EO95_17130 [Methanosarcina sp. 1.H.T.1A.1]|uniref:hypothetical protein n=1 Tax=Methanosarcina sp. 1.H.T.1A.1 TaxID=1483602 RepID=UPI0006217664|nr:hypothetical protein [Methanosarcina sp. 1.H.T.1A.1]KKH99098.1 hypothetical protein EO95_17130 [Methanosarcina sp. 1.H.T.1A.1]